jgi:MYND finger
MAGMEVNGARPIGNTRKLESCAWCHQTHDTTTETKLFKCNGCKWTYYCCPEHQKLHWKQHKKECGDKVEALESCQQVVRKTLEELVLAEKEEK